MADEKTADRLGALLDALYAAAKADDRARFDELAKDVLIKPDPKANPLDRWGKAADNFGVPKKF